MSIQELEAEILKLNIKDRVTLIETLIASLDDLDDAENLRVWAEEAEKRSARAEQKGEKMISAEDVYAKIKALSQS